MKPNSYNIALALLYCLAMSGLYVIDTPHPAAMAMTAFAYIIVRQNMVMDRCFASIAMYASTIEAQIKYIKKLKDEGEK